MKCLFVVLGIFLAVPASLTAQTVTNYFVFKATEYRQSSSSLPVVNTADPTGPYGYDVGVKGTFSPTALSSLPTFTGPASGAPAGTLSLSGGRYDNTASYSSKSALDAAFPNGTYNLTIPGFNSNAAIPLSLTGDAYPTTIPQVTGTSQINSYWDSITGALVIDPTQALTINYGPFSQYGTGVGSREAASILGKGTSFTNPPTALSINIPANSFTAGSSYTAILEFDYDTQLNNTSISGAIGTAVYANQTVFTITAIPEPSTYAALFGLGALGFAAYRRRRGHAI